MVDTITSVTGPKGAAQAHAELVARDLDGRELPAEFADGDHLQGVPTLDDFANHPPRGLVPPGHVEPDAL